MVECWTEDPEVPGSNTNQGSQLQMTKMTNDKKVTIVNDMSFIKKRSHLYLDSVIHKNVTIVNDMLFIRSR